MKRKHPKKAYKHSEAYNLRKTAKDQAKAAVALSEINKLEAQGYDVPVSLQNKVYAIATSSTPVSFADKYTSLSYIHKEAKLPITTVKGGSDVVNLGKVRTSISAKDIEETPVKVFNKMLTQKVRQPGQKTSKPIYSYKTAMPLNKVLKKMGYNLYDKKNKLKPGDYPEFTIAPEWSGKPETLQRYIKFKDTAAIDKSDIEALAAYSPYVTKEGYAAFKEALKDDLYNRNVEGTNLTDQQKEDLSYILNNTNAWLVAQRSIKYEEGDRERYRELVNAVAEASVFADTHPNSDIMDQIQQFIDTYDPDDDDNVLEAIKDLIDAAIKRG